MVRRLLAGLVVVGGVYAAVVPAAVASPLPVPGDRLTVVVSGTGGGDGTFQLDCGPVGGDHPRAEQACERLGELALGGGDPFAPVPPHVMCTMQYGGPGAAHVTGIWQGRSVDASFNRGNGCEISRWNTLVPVLPDARA
ncbi:SSI family serine proteinase inhibitor [Streptomyces sp. NBC_01465]|uniref:SSI family serine proteinase inhibitor n=1 Tax=Streptomyces sp. NBC_01465 TaxID=2903878 RepID=UPI002E307C2F|nr:SSI family serine proteinase inhibitor [Streptomyces sp. NBC_01465]